MVLLVLRNMLPGVRALAAAGRRRSFSNGGTPFYAPTLVERRENEGGRGGRASEAGVKVACFGASGFLGNYVCAELGTGCVWCYKN